MRRRGQIISQAAVDRLDMQQRQKFPVLAIIELLNRAGQVADTPSQTGFCQCC